MKKLIFSVIACLFLMTSCFETPLIDLDVMEYEEVTKFVGKLVMSKGLFES